MKDLAAVEDRETLKYVIRHELKSFGIKVPKNKRSSVRCTQSQGKERPNSAASIFGSPLDEVPAVHINVGSACDIRVPKFLVDSVQFLLLNIDCEGLFRKPGSRTRQKELQRIVENDGPIPSDAHVHDVAGLFKLFFRQLPDPLISSKLTEALIKCRQLSSSQEIQYTTNLLCLTLPTLHINTLRYAVQFLKQVAASVAMNKMDASNLALVMTPNLMGGFKTDKGGSTTAMEKLLRLQTAIVRHLIENADDIGAVPDAIIERVASFGNRSGDLLYDRLTSEDELDKSAETALDERKKNRRRRRSGPIQGLMSGIGQSLGRLKYGAGSSVAKTPAVDEIIENPSFLGETPRILRSSKRKASEDLGAFSSAKRKAMLHQMTVDPQYSKPGLSLHKDGRHGLTATDSPITPIRPNRPALGEKDAVAEDGATVFKFETPSIKFADESLTTFCATPSGISADVTGAPGISGKKYGKLNPLSSKKYKRRSGVMHGDLSTPKTVYGSHTPKSSSGVYESIKKRLGHKHTRTQPTPIQLNDMPDKSVGWRLANPAKEETSGISDILALGCSPNLRRTPLIRRKQRRQKTPSSPATLFSPHVAKEAAERSQKGDAQRSAVHSKAQGSAADAGVDSESPKVMVVDLKSTSNQKDASDFYQESQIAIQGSEDVSAGGANHYEGMMEDKLEGVRWAPPAQRDESKVEGDASSGGPSTQEGCSTGDYQSLEHSISHKSLSSVLSQVSVESTKSVFSVEMEYESALPEAATENANDATMQNDNTLVTDTTPAETERDLQLCSATASNNGDRVRLSTEELSASEDADNFDGDSNSRDCQAVVSNGDNNECGAVATDMIDGDDGYTGSVDSLVSINADEGLETKVSHRLVKSVSVDSGKGLSLDDLATFSEAKIKEAIERRMASERGIKTVQDIPHGLVKMMSDRLSPVEDASGESSCSISSEENPQFRETKAFWKLAKTGHLFKKSLSDSQVSSPTRGPCRSPVRSYHSKMHVKKEKLRGTRQRDETSYNSSMVKSNIDMFNSMCDRSSPVQKLRSQEVCHGGLQVSQNAPGEISKDSYPLKTSLTKSVSIDSGMCKVGSHLGSPEANPLMKTSSRGHDSYEMAFLKDSTMANPTSVQQTMDDMYAPKLTDSQSTQLYENAEEMPVHDGDQGADHIPDHLAPVHALHNESLTPMKLASSTIIRTPGKKSIKIKHRSPLKQLQISNTDVTPTLKEMRSHKRYPCSPRNPLQRQQPCLSRERPLIASNVQDDMDVVEL